MRLLVVGGAGFIGSHIVEQALASARPLEVAVLDNLSSGRRGNVPAGIPFYHVDVRDPGAVLAAFEEFRPQVVSLQAAQASVAVSVRDPLLDAGINILGGLNVLQAAVATGVGRVVFASSGGAIYGEVAPGHAAGEDDPKHPFSPYAASKLALESYLEMYRLQYGLPSTVLRYANVYGPRQDPHGEAGVIAIFAQRLLDGESLPVNSSSDGDPAGCVRDYVYVGDVAAVNLAAARGELRAGVYNVGSGSAQTTRQAAEALAAALGVTPHFEPRPSRPGDLQRSVLDPARLRAERPASTSFQDGIAATAQWFGERVRGGGSFPPHSFAPSGPHAGAAD